MIDIEGTLFHIPLNSYSYIPVSNIMLHFRNINIKYTCTTTICSPF